MRRRFQGRWARSARPQTIEGVPLEAGFEFLNSLRSGTRAQVHGITTGRKARCRLAALGLLPGSRLQVVANTGIGPLLLSVGDSRLMVERGIAAKVVVQPV